MNSLQIGKHWGFELRIDRSLLVIGFLMPYALAFHVFPAHYPRLVGSTYLAMALACTLLYIGSLLVHELAHCWVAKAHHWPVLSVTLNAFGGTARSLFNSDQPQVEQQIAIVGPLVNGAIAIVLSWVSGLFQGYSVGIAGVAHYIAVINSAIAICNLIPTFPFDGGRFLKAIVWQYTNNLGYATQVTTQMTKGLAYTLFLIGAGELVRLDVVVSAELFAAGWLLFSAAEVNDLQFMIQQQLQNVSVGLLLHSIAPRPNASFWTVDGLEKTEVALQTIAHPEDNMAHVLHQMQISGAQKILVMKYDRLEGVMTIGDIARWLEQHDRFNPSVAVQRDRHHHQQNVGVQIG